MWHEEEHRLVAILAGVHHTLQRVLQRHDQLRGANQNPRKRLSGRLFAAPLYSPHRGKKLTQIATAVGQFRPHDRKDAEGHRPPLHQEKAREKVGQGEQPKIQGISQARGIQPLYPQCVVHAGESRIHEGRFPGIVGHFPLHFTPLQLEARFGA